MSIETIRYTGLPKCIKLSNGTVDVIATTAVGPRILFYGPNGGGNILAQHPQLSKGTAFGIWKPYGGHRLWVWPELFPATYAPDNSRIECVRESDLSIRLHQPEDDAAIEKHIRVTLAPEGSKVQLEQTITSRNVWPVDIAPWAISLLSPEPLSSRVFPLSLTTTMSPRHNRLRCLPTQIFAIHGSRWA